MEARPASQRLDFPPNSGLPPTPYNKEWLFAPGDSLRRHRRNGRDFTPGASL
jgi:hypothetical protein